MISSNSSIEERNRRIDDAMRRVGPSVSKKGLYSRAFLVYQIKTSVNAYSEVSKAVSRANEGDALVEAALNDAIANVDDKMVLDAVGKLSSEDLRAYLLAGPAADGRIRGNYSTPDGVASLAVKILEVKDGDTVIDFGSGVGGFLEHVSATGVDANLIGVENDGDAVAVARMRARASGSGATYECGDMFEFYESKVANNKVDKAFSNYPWSIREKVLEEKTDYFAKALEDISRYGRLTSSDWVFNHLLVNSISEDGIAVGIMSNGSAFNVADSRVRRHFIEKGWVKAAISLPGGVFSHWTGAATTLVVFCHGNVGGIRLVDATDLGTKGRRGVSLTDDDIQIIASRLCEDSDKSAMASVDDLAQREYTLSARRFLQKEIKLINPVVMGDIIVEVTRGAFLRAQELDELSCCDETGFHYLNLANIADGSIDDRLPCIKEIDPKFRKSCLTSGDLLISKNGGPYKVAVAKVPDGQEILANGNLYIIKLDKKKANPYYIAAFFNSPDGRETLDRASRDGVFPSLSLRELRNIKVPLKSKEAQDHIAAAYLAKLDEIGGLKLRLARARGELNGLFDEES